MGLREINAARTRQLLATTAMQMFLEQGYESTTLEDVAQRAGVGISTLYRYFPTKEQLGTAFLGDPGLMADELTGRPAEEDTETALGHALVALLEHTRGANPYSDRFRELTDANARLHGRLLEWLSEAYEQLCVALAARRGVAADDVGVAATAWMAVFVLKQVDDRRGEEDGPTLARRVMTSLSAAPLLTPQSPADPT
ncbi:MULTISPECIES: TetR/AcrR family transcriptional regulator [Aeromicrobium]|jgi:AcrR family transcriptional regulator|uniref:TetR/AcrR family transcriptional regulator n=1 Tax=Aeromicrobium TaxID=2040 RepID=UPI00082D55CE|nr:MULTISPECIES: TetR/AcrR family transcriptional regulator [Aeromicrobium]